MELDKRPVFFFDIDNCVSDFFLAIGGGLELKIALYSCILAVSHAKYQSQSHVSDGVYQGKKVHELMQNLIGSSPRRSILEQH